MIRLVFAGTAPFGEPVLEALDEHPEVDLAGVFSQPDRPGGRGQEVQSPPIATRARELDLPLFQPETMNEDGLDRLRSLGDLDAGILVAYGQLLSPEVFDYPEHGMLNFHASLLPRWRGATPIRHTLMEGDGETGVTVFRIVEELDAGPIAHQVRTAVEPGETYEELYDRLSHLNLVGLNLLLSDLRDDTLDLRSQEGEPSYAPRLESDAAEIDWTDSGERIARHVRAFCPDPGAYTYFRGDRVKVYRIQPIEAGEPSEPGSTLQGETGQLVVKAGEGAVAIEELQPAGSRRLSVKEFLAGRTVDPGESWGNPD